MSLDYSRVDIFTDTERSSRPPGKNADPKERYCVKSYIFYAEDKRNITR